MCSTELAHKWLKVWGEYRGEDAGERCYSPRSHLRPSNARSGPARSLSPVRPDVDAVYSRVAEVEQVIAHLAPILREILRAKYQRGLSDEAIIRRQVLKISVRDLRLLRCHAVELVAIRLTKKLDNVSSTL